MNSLLRKAQSEMKKLKRADAVYGLESVQIILDFSRPGKHAKFMPLTTIRVSKKTAQALEDSNRKKDD